MAQATLRITQRKCGDQGRHRVELAACISGQSLSPVTVEFFFAMTVQDRTDTRWYLEDYLEFPEHPASQIAGRVEKRMAEIGTMLFDHVFNGSADASRIWGQLRPHLVNTRIEVAADIGEAAAIPWELIREPEPGNFLALTVQAFVRCGNTPIVPLSLVQEQVGKVRILLVICRPRGAQDVPFRSVAGRLAKGLSTGARQAFELTVLRPPTFETLERTLRQQAEDIIATQQSRDVVFERALADSGADAEYHAVIIDVAPSFSWFQTCGMIYARHVLTPVAMEPLSIQGAVASISAAMELNVLFKRSEPIRVIGLLPVMVNQRMAMTEPMMESLRRLSQQKDVPLLPIVRTDTAVVKAANDRVFLGDYDSKSKAWDDYNSVADQLLKNFAEFTNSSMVKVG